MYSIIIISIISLYILYVYVNKKNDISEHFTVCDRLPILDSWKKMIPFWNRKYNPNLYKLIDSDIYTTQGTPLPLKPSKMLLKHNNDIPTVDGTKSAPRSLAVFAYNKAKPECCAFGNGGYSTSGGCVCITPEQEKWFANVAGNRRNGYDSI